MGNLYKGDLLETERAARQVFSLPIHPMVGQDDLDDLSSVLEKILARQ
jgi:dTDP-4-amino-4,6-dideoxygalactose transaminase